MTTRTWAIALILLLALGLWQGLESHHTRHDVGRVLDRLNLSPIGDTRNRVTLMTSYETTIDCPALGGPTTIKTTCEVDETIEACWARHKKAVAVARADCEE